MVRFIKCLSNEPKLSLNFTLTLTRLALTNVGETWSAPFCCLSVFFVADKWVVGNRTYPLTVWLFTTTPGVFGLIPGCANLTGWALWAIAFIMGICSLPFIRKSGRFEVLISFWLVLFRPTKLFARPNEYEAKPWNSPSQIESTSLSIAVRLIWNLFLPTSNAATW